MGKVKKPIYKRFWFWILIVIFAGMILGSPNEDKPVSGGSKESNEKKPDKKVEEEVEQTEFKLGEVISYKDFDLVFENPRELKSITGSDTYLVLDVTVTSKKDNFTFFGDIQGVTDDNEVINDTIPFVNESLGDPIATAWIKDLNKDQKAKGYLAFDREIEKIEVKSSFFKNDTINIILE